MVSKSESYKPMKDRFLMHSRNFNTTNFLPDLKIGDNFLQLLTKFINIARNLPDNSPLDMMVRIVLNVNGQISSGGSLNREG